MDATYTLEGFARNFRVCRRGSCVGILRRVAPQNDGAAMGMQTYPVMA